MESKKKFIINISYIALIIALIFVFLKIILPLITPFVIAFIIAYILQRPIRIISKRFNKINKKLLSLIVTAIFFCTIGLIIFVASLKLISAIGDLITNMPYVYDIYIRPALIDFFSNMEESLGNMDPNLVSTVEGALQNFMDSAGEAISNVSGWIMSTASGVAISIPGLFINLVVMIISTFFISMDYDHIKEFILRQLDDEKRRVFLNIKEYVVGTLFVCICSYALIMSITFVELSIGLTIIGIENSVLIALMIAIFDILPVLGTGGIMIPWTIIEFLMGNYTLARGLLLVYVVITIIRNILEPKIVGSQIGLHPVITLISMFVGVHFFGVIGLFGFPITISLLTNLNKKGIIKLYK